MAAQVALENPNYDHQNIWGSSAAITFECSPSIEGVLFSSLKLLSSAQLHMSN
jgi:hypothetical protein